MTTARSLHAKLASSATPDFDAARITIPRRGNIVVVTLCDQCGQNEDQLAEAHR